ETQTTREEHDRAEETRCESEPRAAAIGEEECGRENDDRGAPKHPPREPEGGLGRDAEGEEDSDDGEAAECVPVADGLEQPVAGGRIARLEGSCARRQTGVQRVEADARDRRER